MQIGKVFPGSVVVAGLLGLSGCDLLLGLDSPELYPNSTVTVTTTSTSTAGGGGAGGMGGMGGGTSSSEVCSAGEVTSCYTGPNGTAGVGICKAGTQTCLADRSEFGPCENEVLPSTEDCATPVDDDCDGAAQSCKGELIWAKRFGPKPAANNGYASVRAVAVDSKGDVIVAGAFTGSIDFGGIFLTSTGQSLTDVFVAKLNGSTGATFWAKRFGDSAPQECFAIAVDPDGNIALVGQMMGSMDVGNDMLSSAGSSDAFLAKLDTNGDPLWAKRFGDLDFQEATGIAIEGTGKIILAGSFAGKIDLGGGDLTSAGSRDLFAAHFNADGAHLWSNRYGNSSIQSGAHVGSDPDGNTLLTGQFAQSIDLGGGFLPSQGDKDIAVGKLDTNGMHVWSKAFGGVDEQRVNAITGHPNGGLLIAGAFFGSISFGPDAYDSAGDTDGFLAMLQSDGAPFWSAKFGDGGSQEATAIAVDPVGNVLLTGAFDGSVNLGGDALASAGALDICVAKFDQAGAHQWSKRFGDSATQRAVAVATDSTGNVFLGGTFSGTVDFGGDSLVAESGSFDGFVVKLGP